MLPGHKGGTYYNSRNTGHSTVSSIVKDAASVVLVRNRKMDPMILMGRRGSGAAFMPSKYVFPGGAVDAEDDSMRLLGTPGQACLDRMQQRCAIQSATSILLCAVREVWEETGLRLAEKPASPMVPKAVPSDWRDFCGPGWLPSARGLVFFYRAITPPGNVRRFDARFLYGDIDDLPLVGDPDDFGLASDELADLQWIRLSDACDFNIPFVTSLVLGELKSLIDQDGPPQRVPFRFMEDGVRKTEFL